MSVIKSDWKICFPQQKNMIGSEGNHGQQLIETNSKVLKTEIFGGNQHLKIFEKSKFQQKFRQIL